MADSSYLDGAIVELKWWQAGSWPQNNDISSTSRIEAHRVWSDLSFHARGKARDALGEGGNESWRYYSEDLSVPISVLGKASLASTWKGGNPSGEHFQGRISPFPFPTLPLLSLSSFSFTWFTPLTVKPEPVSGLAQPGGPRPRWHSKVS